jgi:UDP-N-acetylmuramate dehydrogenase
MSWIFENVPLAPFTTLGIGGPARFLAEATEENRVLEALDFAANRGIPVFILGGGSNTLIADSGFPGLVLRVALYGIRHHGSGQSGIFTAAAGEDWDPVVRMAVERNWAGIECLSGIPGTVGGTPVQNVGAYGEEVSEVIVSVRLLDREKRSILELGNAQCGFTYRTSLFNTTMRDRYIVLSVTYALRVNGKPRIDYSDLQRYFAGTPGDTSLTAVREAVLSIRAGKAMLLIPGDPDSRSAGSFFKNPIVSEAAYLEIQEAARRGGFLSPAQTLPRYKAPVGNVKVPAAWLIERSGFPKGYARGRVGLSSKHTLALVNRGGATAKDVLNLAREIQTGVKRTFGVDLVPEPVFVGFDP